MRSRSTVLLVAALLVVAGCTSDAKGRAIPTPTTATRAGRATTAVPGTASPTSTVPTTSAADAPKLPDRYVAEAIPGAQLGRPADLGDGLSITVSHPRIAHDATGPWIEVDVVAENAGSGRATSAPGVQLVCSGLSDGGGNLDGQSYPTGGPLPPGSSTRGTARLVLPGDGRFGDPQLCLYPAYVRVDAASIAGKPVQRRFDLSEALVTELNHEVSRRLCTLAPTGCAPPTT
jgi:hypothetical protein